MFNAFRLANFSRKEGDEVKVFLLAEGAGAGRDRCIRSSTSGGRRKVSSRRDGQILALRDVPQAPQLARVGAVSLVHDEGPPHADPGGGPRRDVLTGGVVSESTADKAKSSTAPDPEPVLGLRENLAQFSLLVLVNAFVGGMVGLERVILPLIAEQEFGLVSKSVILSFIVGFGFVKAFTNLAAGRFSDRIGRKALLVGGWIVGLPIPFILMWAPSWGWITVANFLLGINQGLCWSTTVIMKIDLVGPQRRGLAMGLNEFSGYLAVSLAALATGYIAAAYGLRPAPFYLGVGFVVLGLILSLFFVRETHGHARHEAERHGSVADVPFKEIFARTSYKDPTSFPAARRGW